MARVRARRFLRVLLRSRAETCRLGIECRGFIWRFAIWVWREFVGQSKNPHPNPAPEYQGRGEMKDTVPQIVGASCGFRCRFWV